MCAFAAAPNGHIRIGPFETDAKLMFMSADRAFLASASYCTWEGKKLPIDNGICHLPPQAQMALERIWRRRSAGSLPRASGSDDSQSRAGQDARAPEERPAASRDSGPLPKWHYAQFARIPVPVNCGSLTVEQATSRGPTPAPVRSTGHTLGYRRGLRRGHNTLAPSAQGTGSVRNC